MGCRVSSVRSMVQVIERVWARGRTEIPTGFADGTEGRTEARPWFGP